MFAYHSSSLTFWFKQYDFQIQTYNHAHHQILQSQIFTKYPCQALVYTLDGISLLRSITRQPIGTFSQVDQLATHN